MQRLLLIGTWMRNYLRKDLDQFWKKWKHRFSKKSANPHHIDSETDSQKIANRDMFAWASFDSYADADTHELAAGAAIIGGRGTRSPTFWLGGRNGKCPPMIAHLVTF